MSISWRERLAEAVGPLDSCNALGGGAWRVRAGDRDLVVKVGEGALDEAAGLTALALVPGAPPVPDVVLAEPNLVVTAFIRQSGRSPTHEEAFGRMLARLHSSAYPQWGGGSSFIGACRVDPAPAPDGASFYAARLEELARRCGLDAAIEIVVDRLEELLPPGGPALLHGDLWWGNVLFGDDGRAWLIDPSVHGGHPEEDLAMLALFGAVPDRLMGTYVETRPLDDGWEERVSLFQLYPLLVHTVLFGDGYRAQAEAAARRYA